MKKKRNNNCYICGRQAETRDHIPPKGIFENPRPTDLITVPACNECNNIYATDDEYFRWFIATASAENPTAEKLIDNKILPRFRRRPALLNRILGGLRSVDIYSPGGIFLEQRPAFDFDRARIQKVVEKIVKGLYWHNKRCYRLSDKYFVKDFILNPKPPSEEIIKAVLSLPFGQVGRGEVFCYHYWKYPKDEGITAWFLWFFKKTLILAMTDLKGRKYPIAVQKGHADR